MITSEHVIASFLAGLVSFFAPCLLPLFPTYFSVISGFTFSELYGLDFDRIKNRVFFSSLFFIAGFSLVFTMLGATGFLAGQLLEQFLPGLLRLSGLLLIGLGVVQLRLVNIELLRFDFAWRIQKRLTNLGFITAFATGVASALSWIPCVGPLLTPILLLAGESKTVVYGAVLLFIYSLGLTTPFFLAGLFFPRIASTLQKYRYAFHMLSMAAGFILIGFGGILLLDKYSQFTQIFNEVSNW